MSSAPVVAPEPEQAIEQAIAYALAAGDAGGSRALALPPGRYAIRRPLDVRPYAAICVDPFAPAGGQPTASKSEER